MMGRKIDFQFPNVTIHLFSSLQCLNWSTKGEYPHPRRVCMTPEASWAAKLSQAALGSAVRGAQGWGTWFVSHACANLSGL